VSDNFSDRPAPRIDESTTLGSLSAASRVYVGKNKEGKPLYVKRFFAVLDGAVYIATVVAHDTAEKDLHEQMSAALNGLQWADVRSGVRGPWLTPFASFTDVRKDAIDAGKEAPVTTSAFTVKKPAAFSRLKFNAAEVRFAGWIFAVEARREKENAYAFVGIQKFSMTDFQKATPPTVPESKIDELEQTWKTDVQDPVTTPKGGKSNKKEGGYLGAKGHSYQFSGSVQGVDVLEDGWVLKQGQNVFMLRIQYCGKNAKSVMEGDVKSLLKSFKFS
jgi:hypothetical protein